MASLLVFAVARRTGCLLHIYLMTFSALFLSGTCPICVFRDVYICCNQRS
uniref:Uncharacterized protein n=1 Tax=Arundo donax TaxID=35708 RepID=A0A0A8YJ93_ARUDO